MAKFFGLCREVSHVHQTQDSSIGTCGVITAMPVFDGKPLIFREKKMNPPNGCAQIQ